MKMKENKTRSEEDDYSELAKMDERTHKLINKSKKKSEQAAPSTPESNRNETNSKEREKD